MNKMINGEKKIQFYDPAMKSYELNNLFFSRKIIPFSKSSFENLIKNISVCFSQNGLTGIHTHQDNLNYFIRTMAV